MMKNHEIIEYIPNSKDVNYVRKHEGFLFCFEKYDPDQLVEKNSC